MTKCDFCIKSIYRDGKISCGARSNYDQEYNCTEALERFQKSLRDTNVTRIQTNNGIPKPGPLGYDFN